MNYWLINVRCREFQELEPEPSITSRFILCSPGATDPSVRLIFNLISHLRLDELPGVSTTTTDYRIGRLVGDVSKVTARKPDIEKDDLKVWQLKRQG